MDAIIWRREITDDWSWIENQWIPFDDGGTQAFEVSHRLYSGYELKQLMERVGFETVSLFGGFDGSATDHEAEQLVVIAEK